MHGDLPREELLTQGRAMLDWIGEYLEHSEQYPVLSQVRPGEVRASLPASPPVNGESLEAIFRDFESKIVPGITHWNHPSFFGYFATSSSVPGILAELLTAALDVKAMLWRTAPAATELEQLTMHWLRQMLGLGDGWFGIMTDTASISSMLALAGRVRRSPSSRFASAAWLVARIFRGCAYTRRSTRIRRWTRRRSRSGSASRMW